MKKAFSVSIILVWALVFCGGAYAETINLRFTTIATEKDPWGQSILGWANSVNENSGGRINVTTYLAGKLGSGKDTISQVVRGRIDGGGFQLTDATILVKEMEVLGTPFLFDSEEQGDCVLDDHMAPVLDKMLQKKGLKLVRYLYIGSWGFASKEPFLVPADVQDVKMKCNQSTFGILTWESVGANPVPLPMVEFPAALQTGMVKGGDITPIYYLATGLNKMAPHYTYTQHIRNVGLIVMSLKTWNRLNEDQQKLLKDAWEPIDSFRKKIRGMETAMMKKYEGAGGPVHYLTPEQKKQWADIVVPNHKKLIDKVGGDAAELYDRIQKAKAACGK